MASKRRDYHFYVASLAEQNERYQEMVQSIHSAILIDPHLTPCQRNLFSIAYKAAINKRKISMKAINHIIRKDQDKKSVHVTLAKEYKDKIEGEIYKYCRQIIHLIDHYLLPASTEKLDYQVFYLKIKAEHIRCIGQYTDKESSASTKQGAREAYQSAHQLSRGLTRMNSLRYGIALRYSQFCFQVLNDHKLAFQIANQVLNCQISEFCHIPIDENQYKEITFFMQLIRDNITVWSSDLQYYE